MTYPQSSQQYRSIRIWLVHAILYIGALSIAFG
jgi:hypothetical protein